MKKVLVLDVIQPDAKELLRKYTETTEIEKLTTDELAKIAGNYDAMVSRNRPAMPNDVVDLATNMKVIGVASVGTDFIDEGYAKQKGILVFNCPGGNADSVAEMTIGFMTVLLHDAQRAANDVKNGIWDRSRYESHQLIGKTVGLIAVGNIGKRVAQFLNVMDCTVLAFDPFISDEAAAEMNVKKVSLEELLKTSDVVSVHAPLMPSTRHMIAAPQLNLMKKDAYLLNMSRGGIVNEEDLYDALVNKKIKAAASDVMEKEPCLSSPLYQLENFFVTPHFAGVTVEARRIIDMMMAHRLLKELGIQEN